MAEILSPISMMADILEDILKIATGQQGQEEVMPPMLGTSQEVRHDDQDDEAKDAHGAGGEDGELVAFSWTHGETTNSGDAIKEEPKESDDEEEDDQSQEEDEATSDDDVTPGDESSAPSLSPPPRSPPRVAPLATATTVTSANTKRRRLGVNAGAHDQIVALRRTLTAVTEEKDFWRSRCRAAEAGLEEANRKWEAEMESKEARRRRKRKGKQVIHVPEGVEQ